MIYIARAAGATTADDRTMPQRRARLARGRVQPLQDPRASRSMLDVGVDAPYPLVVTRDGALALPPIESWQVDHATVESFNRCFARFLIDAVHSHALSATIFHFTFLTPCT